MRSCRGVSGLAIVLLLAGCQSGPQAVEPSAPELEILSGARVPSTLEAGDKIRVTVFGEDKLSGDYDIDAAGFVSLPVSELINGRLIVSLPLAGTVQAAGLSRAQLEASLGRRYRGAVLRDPKITVDIAAYRPFYILGEVEKPGEYAYRSGLNVLSATAVAGGPTYRASRSDVLIQKGGTGPFLRVPLSPAIPVLPGDLIRVPERYF